MTRRSSLLRTFYTFQKWYWLSEGGHQIRPFACRYFIKWDWLSSTNLRKSLPPFWHRHRACWSANTSKGDRRPESYIITQASPPERPAHLWDGIFKSLCLSSTGFSWKESLRPRLYTDRLATFKTNSIPGSSQRTWNTCIKDPISWPSPVPRGVSSPFRPCSKR